MLQNEEMLLGYESVTLNIDVMVYIAVLRTQIIKVIFAQICPRSQLQLDLKMKSRQSASPAGF